MSYTVKVKDLAAVALANYGVSIHASGGIRLDSSCSGARYLTHDPENKSESFSIMVYGTTVGEGTLTATLVFADDDAFEGEVVASDDDAIEVELTVKFSDPSYSVDEGEDGVVTVELSGENCETLEIPVNITLGTAESTDFSVTGLSSGSLSFSARDTSESFTIETNEDMDCDDETINLSFGTLPDGVEEGSPSTATFQINDDSCPIPTPTVMFSHSSYSVDEGDEEDVTVILSHASSSDLEIPITVAPGTAERNDYTIRGLSNDSVNVTFRSGITEVEFTIRARQDNDCSNERLDLGFGRLPLGVGLGSPDEATFRILDDEDPSECLPTPTPTVMFSDSSYSVDEGDEEDVTVILSHASSSDLEIPITVAPGTAERNDYTIRGLSNDSVNVTFRSGITEVEFTIRARQDNDCSNERLDLGFGLLPTGVGLGSPHEADFDIDDDEDPIECIPTPTPTPTPTPFITIVDLVDRLEEGETNNFQMGEYDDFQVVASNLNSRTNYMIKVTTNHSGAQFVSGCSDRETEFRVSRVTSYTADLTLYGCDGVNPAKVKAELLVGATVIDTDTHDVIVFPAIAQPTITPQPPENKNIILKYSSLSNSDFSYQAGLFPAGADVADTHTRLFTVVTQRILIGPTVHGFYAVRIRACEDSTFANCGKYSPSSDSLRKLMPPQDVDVTPHPQRMAVLTWNRLPTEFVDYEFSVTYPGASSPVRTTTIPGGPISFTHNIDLDNVIPSMSLGLADKSYFEYKIEPKLPIGSFLAAEKTRYRIIDTPITAANGDSPGLGQAKLDWLLIKDVLNDNTFAGGTYSFRYRQAGDHLGDDHTQLNWRPGNYVTNTTVGEADLLGGNTIGGQNHSLDKEAIYAIQLRYEKTGKPTVYAARDVYVWPSDRAAGGGERIATYPLNYPVPNNEYAYRICGGLPATTTPNTWEQTIAHALEQWQVYTDNLIKMTYLNGESCADYEVVLDKIVDRFASRGNHDLTASEKASLSQFLGSLGELTDADADNSLQNEVRVIDDSAGSKYDRLIDIAVFPEFSKELGLANCVFATGVGGCAVPRHTHPITNITFTDILLRGSTFASDPLTLPGTDLSVERDDTPFNTCSAPRIGAYETLLHEAGHALGIRDGNGHADWESSVIHHPTTADSVMSYESTYLRTDNTHKLPDDPDCSPHPFDVLAIYAMYQTTQ